MKNDTLSTCWRRRFMGRLTESGRVTVCRWRMPEMPNGGFARHVVRLRRGLADPLAGGFIPFYSI